MFIIRKRRCYTLRFFCFKSFRLWNRIMKIIKNDQVSLKSTHNDKIKPNILRGKTNIVRGSSLSPEKLLISTNNIENILLSLKSPQVMKLKVLAEVLPPLNEVIRLWYGKIGDPLDSDSLLVEKFITSWLKKHGEYLPLKQKKDLTGLSNLLRSRRLEALDNENDNIYSINSEGDVENPQWKVRFQYRQNPGSERCEEQISCVFDLNSEHLGEVRTVVTVEDNHNNCLFQTSRKETAKSISNSLPEFRKQLGERGVVLDQIHVSRKRENLLKKKISSSKGLDLWG